MYTSTRHTREKESAWKKDLRRWGAEIASGNGSTNDGLSLSLSQSLRRLFTAV